MTTKVELKINNFIIPSPMIEKFEWRAKINSGYVAYVEVNDPHFKFFDIIFNNETFKYLENARQRPVKVNWTLEFFSQSTKGKNKTSERLGYLTNLKIYGNNTTAKFSFFAQDPPTFLLSAGIGDGRVYKGKIGGKDGVIARCIKDFGTISEIDREGSVQSLIQTSLASDISETNDSKNGIWPMFRLDPMNYIISLLEWSSPLTKSDSRWIISCSDEKINIKKAKDLRGKNLGVFNISSQKTNSNDIFNWDIDLNNFLTQYQARLVTAGMSSTTGEIINQFVDDEATKNKVTPLQPNSKDRAPTKPKNGDDWPEGLPATFIRSIPEHSGGEVIKNYKDYIDGRARQTFDDMLSSLMRMTICVPGVPELDDSELLGVSTCTINWARQGSDPWFAHGPWIIDGFSHSYRMKPNDHWLTYIDLYRIDWDSKAVTIDPPPS